jgi:DNA-binding beta-propeller fold protein YncE
MMKTLRSFAVRSLSRRAAILLLCAGTVVPLSASDSRKSQHRERDTVWVVNRDQGTVMVFDAATGRPAVASPIPVGAGAHDIVSSPRTGAVFVSDDSSRVYVLSTKERRVIEIVQFNPGTRPHHLSLSHDGKTVWVGLFSSNRIASIDTDTYAVNAFASSLQPGVTAHAPEPSRDGRFVFVPHEGQNLVTKLSVASGTVRGEASPGPAADSSPSEVLPSHDGRTLFVAMRNEGTVRTIRVGPFTPTVHVEAVGVQPESLILSPGGRTLMVSLRGTPARLAFLDPHPLALEKTLDVAGTGTFGNLAVASPDGRFVYMTFDALAAGQGGVTKVDARKRTVVDTFLYPGAGRPHGVAYVEGHHWR